jgi:tetratricopeptide (TPR) repeat protein
VVEKLAMRASHLLLVSVLTFAKVACAATSDSELDAALGLFKAKRYPETREMLEKIITSEPANAKALHYLGRTIIARNDNAAFEEGLRSLGKAVELEPGNPIYLGIYGGALLQVAGRTNSLSAALKGRDAMEKALAIDPDYLDAREGLFQFYDRAPWPIGSAAKAKLHLDEIRQRTPDLATALGAVSRTKARDFDAAFKMCDEVLARNPDNYTALYQFGRTASISGQNLERGLARLQRCLKLEPPTPASPSHSNVWNRIGNVLEQLDRRTEAIAAYETALKLDPSNQPAAEALGKLR